MGEAATVQIHAGFFCYWIPVKWLLCEYQPLCQEGYYKKYSEGVCMIYILNYKVSMCFLCLWKAIEAKMSKT